METCKKDKFAKCIHNKLSPCSAIKFLKMLCEPSPPRGQRCLRLVVPVVPGGHKKIYVDTPKNPPSALEGKKVERGFRVDRLAPRLGSTY